MKRLLLTLAFVCFVMPALLSADTPEPPLAPKLTPVIRPESVTVDRNGEIHLFAVNTRLPFGHIFYEAMRKTEPPKAAPAPAPVTLESLKARRAQMTELMRQYGEAAKQYAADVAELKRQAKELNIELDIKPVDFGIGKQGPRGYSAYEVAKQNGFKGTQAEWLASLKGPKGDKGDKGDPGTGPEPPPKPPEPPVNPAPIPVDGFRVLIVYQDSELAKLPSEQSQIIYAKEIRNYLASHCVKGADGTPERRIWDKDVDPSGEAKLWQDAFSRVRTSLPWIVVSNGKTGFEGPLPKTVKETLELLKKYGGE